MLESGGVGGVTGDGNAYVFLSHDSNAFRYAIGAVALNLCSVTGGVNGFLNDLYFLGVGIKLGLNVCKTVDSRNDHSGVLAKTVEDYTQGLNSYLVCVEGDLDRTFSSGEGLVTCEEAEALCLFGKKHRAEVTVTKTNLTVFCNRAGDTPSGAPAATAASRTSFAAAIVEFFALG